MCHFPLKPRYTPLETAPQFTGGQRMINPAQQQRGPPHLCCWLRLKKPEDLVTNGALDGVQHPLIMRLMWQGGGPSSHCTRTHKTVSSCFTFPRIFESLCQAPVDSEHLLHFVNYSHTFSDEQQRFASRHVIIGLFGSVYKDFLNV